MSMTGGAFSVGVTVTQDTSSRSAAATPSSLATVRRGSDVASSPLRSPRQAHQKTDDVQLKARPP